MAFLKFEDISGGIEVIVFPKILEKNLALIQEGNVVMINGRLSLREDEDAKIVCEEIFTPPSLEQAKNMAVEKSDVKKTQPNETIEKKAHKNIGLFLRVKSENDECLPKVKNLLSIFDEGGLTPVYFYYTDTKKYEHFKGQPMVQYNEVLIRELKKILGDDNVVVQGR